MHNVLIVPIMMPALLGLMSTMFDIVPDALAPPIVIVVMIKTTATVVLQCP